MRKFVVKAKCPKCDKEFDMEVNPAAMLGALPKTVSEAFRRAAKRNAKAGGGRPIDPNSKRQQRLRAKQEGK
jgi:hypothetical protein